MSRDIKSIHPTGGMRAGRLSAPQGPPFYDLDGKMVVDEAGRKIGEAGFDPLWTPATSTEETK